MSGGRKRINIEEKQATLDCKLRPRCSLMPLYATAKSNSVAPRGEYAGNLQPLATAQRRRRCGCCRAPCGPSCEKMTSSRRQKSLTQHRVVARGSGEDVFHCISPSTCNRIFYTLSCFLQTVLNVYSDTQKICV